MLYLVATPVGNLGDFSFRACELLKSVDYLLCEDTRHSHILLKHYGISKPLKSYHRFKEAKVEEEVVGDLKKGLTIALLSDAGTPGIADPGHRLVCRCLEEGIPCSALPGPCSPILALTLSGFEPTPFQFIGFLPRSEGQLRSALSQVLFYPGTTLCFESPNRIQKTLSLLVSMDKTRKLAICRELTKIHEEILIGTAETLGKEKLLGELVLVISGNRGPDFSALSPKEHVAQLQVDYGLSKQEAIKIAASLRQVPKKEIYF